MSRLRSGLSQGELAELLGCRHGSKVSRYETSQRCPAFETLLAYEVVFGGSGREFFEGRYCEMADEIRDRAVTLFRRLDAQAFTPQVKRKLDFLVDVIHPSNPQSDEA